MCVCVLLCLSFLPFSVSHSLTSLFLLLSGGRREVLLQTISRRRERPQGLEPPETSFELVFSLSQTYTNFEISQTFNLEDLSTDWEQKDLTPLGQPPPLSPFSLGCMGML